jgi:hypothetical protein
VAGPSGARGCEPTMRMGTAGGEKKKEDRRWELESNRIHATAAVAIVILPTTADTRIPTLYRQCHGGGDFASRIGLESIPDSKEDESAPERYAEKRRRGTTTVQSGVGLGVEKVYHSHGSISTHFVFDTGEQISLSGFRTSTPSPWPFSAPFFLLLIS